MTDKTVLVTGATGNQGGAVLEALLDKSVKVPVKVRALVRNARSDKAKALQTRGVELVEGDLFDGDSVERAARGVDTVFVVTSPFVPGSGLDQEIQQGRTIVAALERAGVGHVVYSSVSDADRETGIPHFETKADAERALAASSLAYTITAPVFFNDNLLSPWILPQLGAGAFHQALPVDRALQVVSLRDIGRFNAEVIMRGTALAGRRINYASDELTSGEMAASLSRAMGRPVTYHETPLDQVGDADLAAMFRWFDEVGYTADITALSEEFPEVGWMRFDDWASSVDWAARLA